MSESRGDWYPVRDEREVEAVTATLAEWVHEMTGWPEESCLRAGGNLFRLMCE